MNSKNAYTPLSKKSRTRLRRLLGSRFLEAPEDLKAYAFDASGQEFLPSAVALPETTAEVAAVMRIAASEGFPVIPRGAATATTGAPLAVQGGLVLALNRMDRIIEINTEDLVAVVQPGVLTGRLKQEAAKRGLFYPPDPASYRFSTIGGNVATGAGGPKGLKYGVTKDYVLGLEVVLPNAETVFLGTRTAKGVVGYDLVHLFVGSEGTLGIITQIVLKLLPKPPARAVAVVGFSSLEEATAAFGRVLKSGVLPACAELLDDLTLKAIKRLEKQEIPEEIKALILFEVDGPKAAVEEELLRLKQAVGPLPFYQEARKDQDIEALWEIRRAVSPALKALGRFKIADDVVLPRSRLTRFVNFVKTLRQQTQLNIACFGHLGDGNLHVNILFNDPAKREAALSCREEILQKVLELSGTISGEHGVGLTKRNYLPWELSAPVVRLMQEIKRVFDPKGRMNPGKIF